MVGVWKNIKPKFIKEGRGVDEPPKEASDPAAPTPPPHDDHDDHDDGDGDHDVDR